jgi:hypothetical protein
MKSQNCHLVASQSPGWPSKSGKFENIDGQAKETRVEKMEAGGMGSNAPPKDGRESPQGVGSAGCHHCQSHAPVEGESQGTPVPESPPVRPRTPQPALHRNQDPVVASRGPFHPGNQELKSAETIRMSECTPHSIIFHGAFFVENDPHDALPAGTIRYPENPEKKRCARLAPCCLHRWC